MFLKIKYISSESFSFCAMTDALKRAVGYKAVEEEVKSGMKIGVGSGSTVVYAAERIGQLYSSGAIKDIICIPTSFQAKQLISQYKIPLGDLDNYPELDIAIDGADSIDPKLNAIKGGGGACVQEKIVAMCAKKFIIIADESKYCKDYLGANWSKGLPVEVIPSAYVPTISQIQSKLNADAQLRMAEKKAGPVVTDNGNFLLDVLFDWKNISAEKLIEIDCTLLRLAGVVHTGFFLDMAHVAYVAKKDETVDVITK